MNSSNLACCWRKLPPQVAGSPVGEGCLRMVIPGGTANLMHCCRITPVYLQQTANRQVGIEVIYRLGGAVEQRCDAAGGDHRHCFVPLGLDASNHSFDERNVTPENARLHGANRVVAYHPLWLSL